MRGGRFCGANLSGWITTGPRTKKFESLISEYVHTDKTVCLNSATAALEMVLHLLDIQPDDEVRLPLHTKLTDEDVEYVISNFVDIVRNF